MTTPVGTQQPIVDTQGSSAEPARGTVPQGISTAPTTLQTTEGQSAATERGYIERFVLSIRDWVVWAFKKIFFCFFKSEAPAGTSPATEFQTQSTITSDQTQAGPNAQIAPVRPVQFQLNDTLRSDMELLSAFHQQAEEARCRIYEVIGRSTPLGWDPRNRFRSYETLGRMAVHANPQLLRTYLIRPN